MVCKHMDFECPHWDPDKRMECIARNADLVYYVDSYRKHLRSLFLNAHKRLDRNDNSLHDCYNYILRNYFIRHVELMTRIYTHFCKHLFVFQVQVSMEDHCRNLHKIHSSNPC